MNKQFLQECFTHNESGQLIWNKRPPSHFKSKSSQKTFNAQFSGCVAGTDVTKGNKKYIYIQIGAKRYAAHRLILIMNGIELNEHVDHANGDSLDNRLKNLRAVTQKENNKNIKLTSKNKSGVCGVSWHKANNKWRVRIGCNGRPKHFGFFADIELAELVAKEVYSILGYHKNHGVV